MNRDDESFDASQVSELSTFDSLNLLCSVEAMMHLYKIIRLIT